MIPLIIGLIAGTLCTISFVPQVVKILKTKQTRDISLVTFSVFSAGIFIWMIYGFLIKALPIILANVVGFILTVSIVVMKLKYK